MPHPEPTDIPKTPLTREQLAAVAENTGNAFNGRCLQLPFFGTYYDLTTTAVLGPDGCRIPDKIFEMLIDYVVNYPTGPPPGGHLISYRELKDAGPLVVSFANNTLKTITATFTGKRDKLESAARAIGGSPRPDITGYDLYIEFMALPGIPLILQFNDAQVPFPAQCSLLLDASIENYLNMQSIFVLGTFLCGQLVASGYK